MTDIAERSAELLTTHRRAVIVVLLLATLAIGAGAPMVEEESNLGQFESESSAVNASEFIDEHFVAEGSEDQTTVQVIRRGGEDENVLTREELVASLEFQQAIETHPEIGPTLVDEEPTTGVANIVALYQFGQVFGGLDSPGQLDPERLAQLNQTERVALAGLLGFEGEEAETVAAVFGLAQPQDTGEFEFGDLAEMNETERQAQAEQLVELPMFEDGDEDTILELFDRLATAESLLTVEQLATLDAGEQQAVAALLGVDTFPPEACFVAFQTGEDAPGGTATQRQVPLSCQQWLIEEMDEAAFEEAVQAVLGPGGGGDALSLMPQSYEPGSTTARAHSIFVTQETESDAIGDPTAYGDTIVDAQLALRDLAGDQDREYLVFGLGILGDEIDQSLDDSMALVAPIALLFVLAVLTVAYRDPLDILLGMAGILVVLLWTFGFMGWAGILFNQIMIAVPVLLIGLSIDYAIHVFMRHRERRDAETNAREAMALALAGVGVALVWVTATAAIGFLSNLVSPIGSLRDFGVTSAVGIVAALLVFGALVPAMKIELDSFLEARGFDRRNRAFGTGDSRVSSLLEAGATAARRAPLVVLVVALVLSGVGVYGATQVDTSFNEEDFIAEDPPAWTDRLPEPFAPGEYQVSRDLEFVQANFQQVGREGELLIRGDVTHDEVLLWLDSVAANASEHESIYVLPNGEPDVSSPLSELRDTARRAPDSSFNESFHAAGGNGVPTENISGLYAGMAAINPDASEVVYAADGEYVALRMQIGIDGEVTQQAAAADLQTMAAHLEAESGGTLEVMATGDPVINTEVENDIFETVLESLLITLVAVFGFLAVAYRLTGNPASLGIVTLLPVLFALTWILGTMWLVGIPFNALTGTIAALTIGLGIAYSIHISARYELELRRQGDVWAAMHTTVTGTGGALLGSAATTVGGFGTLAVAILPALQQFGIITAITIVYAFLASVLVLPSLLVLWTRYLGPSEHFPGVAAEGDEAVTEEPVAGPDD